MLPEQVGFGPGCWSTPRTGGVIGIVKTSDDPVAVTARRSLGGPARGGVLVVAGNGAVAVLIRGHSDGDAVEIVNDVLDLCLGDHFLALEDAAEEQADDHEHDCDFDQGETRLGRILAELGRPHATPKTNCGVKSQRNPQDTCPRVYPETPL